ncbi:MAG: hypothetical protein FWB87_04355 [Defluviitaleaceae bacterium]|nr:hypothetical protein [Defluviitaleaceae bacterium]
MKKAVVGIILALVLVVGVSTNVVGGGSGAVAEPIMEQVLYFSVEE